MAKLKLNSRKSVRVPEPVSVLSRDQDIIVQSIALIQGKYKRGVYLYSANVTFPSLFNVLYDMLKHSRFLDDLKLLVQCGILREGLGGVYHFNNRLCACCASMPMRVIPRPKPFPKRSVDSETRMDMLFKAQVLKERVGLAEPIPEAVIRPKKSKAKKPQSGKHAAKIANQMTNKVAKIQKIDAEIGKLEQRKVNIRDRWI